MQVATSAPAGFRFLSSCHHRLAASRGLFYLFRLFHSFSSATNFTIAQTGELAAVAAMAFPAGLSSETLDANAQPTTPMQDDQWSDTHTVETDDDRDEIQEVTQPDEDVTIHPPKITTDGKSHDIHTPSSPAASPATAQEHPLDEADVSSVHSVPVVQVT